MNIQDLEPKRLWSDFYGLTQVPRPSGHLDKIREHLVNWAKEYNIEVFVDNAGNVIVRKPATPGMENRKMATLEAHMDMVPQKTPESTHDFINDPLEVYIDGDWVKAKGTTLGSDDGMGIATIMAIFEDDTIKHGPLEAIFTVDEETCMYGVNNLKEGTLKGDILLNLDNETEGDFIIGSAGGEDVVSTLEYAEEDAPADMTAIQLTLKGLKGGHSGLEINEGRANANKCMARLVADVIYNYDPILASWEGGNMRNAIPNSCDVVLLIEAEQKEEVMTLAASWLQTFNNEYAGIEDGIILECKEVATPTKVVPQEIRDNIISAVLACPCGVTRFIPSIPSIVETSCNLGIVKVKNGTIETDVLVRSSCDSQLDFLAQSAAATFSLIGMKVEYSGRYPAWQPDTNSPIIKVMEEQYKKVNNGEGCKISVVHAGLECGVIKTVCPNMDMVSFGPTLCSPHTPNERCYIPSVAKYYKHLLAVLENIPEK